jgi:glucose-1-phosphate adenylyltransferase
MATGPAGELHEFQEKPEHPTPIPGEPGRAYASMGNYIFRPGVLVDLLEETNRNGNTDFGRHIMPLLIRRYRAFAYDFNSNNVPGIQPHEERGYWRDIGTLDAFKSAQSDVHGPLPRFSLFNSEWPIRSDVHCLRRRIVPPGTIDPMATRHIAVVASANAAL